MTIAANFLLVELLILITGQKLLNFPKIHIYLSNERMGIYWGLIVSHMINFILPWKFIFLGGGFRNFRTKVNLAAQQLAFFLLALLIISSLLMEIIGAKKAGKKHYLKISVRKWWSSYENFVYPLLVINDNPYYFFAIIGTSQLVYLVNSCSVPNFRVLAILKAIYPIIFHTCFMIFHLSDDDIVLSYTVIGCLSIFLIGSFHHFIESMVKSIK